MGIAGPRKDRLDEATPPTTATLQHLWTQLDQIDLIVAGQDDFADEDENDLPF
jgi:hypothetical protein